MAIDHRSVQRIVVGVNGSPSSLAALRLALVEAHRTGAEVLTVLAWKSAAHVPEMLIVEREQAQNRLGIIVAEAALGLDLDPDLDVRLITAAPLGPAGPVLTKTANREGDLLVIGAPRRHLLTWSSVSRFCLSHATCPVLIVPFSGVSTRTAGRRIDTSSRNSS